MMYVCAVLMERKLQKAHTAVKKLITRCETSLWSYKFSYSK